MSQVTCPVCEFYADDNAYLKVHSGFKLYHCPKCELEYWWPRKLDRAFYEGGGDYQPTHVGAGELKAYHRTFFRHRSVGSGLILDIGCGDGAFLKEAERLGYEAYGIDLDRKSVEAARNARKLENVYGMTLDEFADFSRKRSLRFQLATFFEVLEHQDEPREFLAKVMSLLEPGGFIAGSVPNRDRLIIHRETFDYPPNHFTWWSQPTLGRFLGEMGFEQLMFKTEFDLQDSLWFVETQLLGDFDHRLKRYLKQKVFRVESTLVEAPLAFSAGTARRGRVLTRLLPASRAVMFLLPTLALAPWLKPHLYFQGAKAGSTFR